MRSYFAAIVTAATLSALPLVASGANAMTVGTVSGIQQGLANTSVIEQVVRVCRRNWFTGKRECWTDRSRPPTVCHWVRNRAGNMVRDCY